MTFKVQGAREENMTPKQWGDYWTNHVECSRRVWKFYQYLLHRSKKLDRFPNISEAIRLLGLIRLSSGGVERHFSLLKRIMDVFGEKIEHTTLETRLMVLVRTQSGVSWDGNNLPSYDFNQLT